MQLILVAACLAVCGVGVGFGCVWVQAELCDALQTCFDNWEFEWGGHEDEYVSAAVAEDRYPDWRTVANDETIKRREGTKPADNNYDGRNYITE